jgi:hypothetical protein
MTCWSPLRTLVFLIIVAALAVLLAPRNPAWADANANANANDDGEQALVRVLAEEAAVHTGPGFGFRVVYTAARGEVLPAIGRSTQDHWFRVQLPDGTFGWLLGDQVLVLDVDTSAAQRGPSAWKRISDAIFSPPPLADGQVGLTFSAGALGGDGLFLFRPSVVLAPPLTLEGFFGETVGNQVDVIYYGGGFNAFLWPTSPVTPFVAAAAGGASSRKKPDQPAIQTGNFKMVNVGGGLIIALKKRLTLRGDARHYVIFDANHTQRIQEYSGALSIYF